jgi:ABC-type glycerol-3-phosphate transport system permease component
MREKINLSWIVLLILSIIWIIPSVGIFMVSIRPIAETSEGWWKLQPFTFTLDNYLTVLTGRGIWKSFVTSIIIAVPATIIPVFIYSLGAYAFALFKFRGRNILFTAVIGSLVLPGQVALIPLLKLLSFLGLIDTYIGIIPIHVAFCLGWAILIFKNFLLSIPFAVIEAAKLDGCSNFRIYWNIALPLSLPVIATVATLQFLWTWNELLFPLVFLKTKVPLTVALTNLKGRYVPEWGLLSAGAIISVAIPLLIFIFLQKYLVKGLTAGVGK